MLNHYHTTNIFTNPITIQINKFNTNDTTYRNTNLNFISNTTHNVNHNTNHTPNHVTQPKFYVEPLLSYPVSILCTFSFSFSCTISEQIMSYRKSLYILHHNLLDKTCIFWSSAQSQSHSLHQNLPISILCTISFAFSTPKVAYSDPLHIIITQICLQGSSAHSHGHPHAQSRSHPHVLPYIHRRIMAYDLTTPPSSPNLTYPNLT